MTARCQSVHVVRKEHNMETGKQKGRYLPYDILRIAACFSVIMLHSSSQFWYDIPVNQTSWLVANSYDASFRFGVPIFVMISGALFLTPEKEISVKRLYTHNIIRLAVAYGFWSCVYGLWDARFFVPSEAGWKSYLLEMLGGSYHLWFVPMMIGIYMLLPVLKSWVQHASRKNIEYFLLLFLIFQIGKETLLVFIQSGSIRQAVGMLSVEMACGYVGYFVLGYYMASIRIPRKLHRWVYVAGATGLVLAVLCGNLQSLRAGEPKAGAYDSFSLFTFAVVAAIFLLGVEGLSKSTYSGKWSKVIQELSASTFGIYLMHILVLDWLKGKGIHSMTVNNIAGIPILALVCFVISCCITALLRRIPVAGKYIC